MGKANNRFTVHNCASVAGSFIRLTRFPSIHRALAQVANWDENMVVNDLDLCYQTKRLPIYFSPRDINKVLPKVSVGKTILITVTTYTLSLEVVITLITKLYYFCHLTLVIAKNWNQSKCSSIVEWILKIVVVHSYNRAPYNHETEWNAASMNPK